MPLPKYVTTERHIKIQAFPLWRQRLDLIRLDMLVLYMFMPPSTCIT